MAARAGGGGETVADTAGIGYSAAMGRYTRAHHLARLDPVADRVEIGRALVQYEFPWDMLRSLELALFRTFAVPSIGALLDRTSEFADHPQRRYDDTVLLLYHLWLDDTAEQRRDAGEHLNFIHGHYRISNEDFRYTLSTFVVVPIRWLQRYGWRPLSTVEVDGWTNLMRDMGAAMRIEDMPETFDEFANLMDGYEAEHFRYTAANARVARATVDLMASWYPAPLRPLVRAATVALLHEHVARAVGLAAAGAGSRRWADRAVRLRARGVRLLPSRPDGKPFEVKVRSYDSDPDLGALGPVALLRRAAQTPPRRSGTG